MSEPKRQAAITAVYDKLHENKLGAHWLWCVIEKIAAGESEEEAMREYGYYSRADGAESDESAGDLHIAYLAGFADGKKARPAAPTEAKPAQDAVDAALAYLDDLKDDAAAHIFPDDLERCMTSECAVQVASVRMGSPDGMTVPLFSREQVADAIRAAISAKKGG